MLDVHRPGAAPARKLQQPPARPCRRRILATGSLSESVEGHAFARAQAPPVATRHGPTPRCAARLLAGELAGV
jgi:hypothetical protein